MKFGFLIDERVVTVRDVEVRPLPQYEGAIEEFYANFRVSRGWVLPHLEPAPMEPEERKRFKKKDGLKPRFPFDLPLTHDIQTESADPEKEKFLILAYGFLQGLYLLPESHIYLWQVPYKPGKLTGLIPLGKDYEDGLEQISYIYDSQGIDESCQLFGIIHWFLVGQACQFLWDYFDAQYKVLDAIWKFSRLENVPHSKRPEKLAEHFGVSVPGWAQTYESDKGKTESRLSKLRNDLVHEARFADAPLGYALPEENFRLEFSAFNLKLICALLGLETPYKQVPLGDRGGLGAWDFGDGVPGN
ncbi:hypothetical protein [Thiohalorhabdus methylotrophus]|uniref:Apea-like HEPN domain-containing protein n=1 Tax=Thiohalorhabdus methylotrophus TaxID=3242694 RepID=A0ABV4TT89_9GAMM